MPETGRGSFEPGFIETDYGPLFLQTYPAHGAPTGRAVVVLPAFAEEMNKCRRQLALAARAFAANGLSTYIPDWIGTGDSSGDFGDATLVIWRRNLGDVLAHVRAQGHSEIVWLAVRGGALLAVDALAHDLTPPSRVVLWQPVPSGKTMLSQFLRLKAMAGLARNERGPGVSTLRQSLAAGERVEVAGYWLHPDLVAGFDGLQLKELQLDARIDWLNVQADGALPTVAQGVVDWWSTRGADVHARVVAGEPFWSTAEIALAPQLIDATVEVLAS